MDIRFRRMEAGALAGLALVGFAAGYWWRCGRVSDAIPPLDL